MNGVGKKPDNDAANPRHKLASSVRDSYCLSLQSMHLLRSKMPLCRTRAVWPVRIEIGNAFVEVSTGVARFRIPHLPPVQAKLCR